LIKKVFFYIDDVIWIFRDLTRKNPKSIFDNPFLTVMKKAHDEYGLKVQLNVFYRTDFYYGNDEFTLADMTDSYKSEWKNNSDWLKFSFHAKQEFPDYPYINADYRDVKEGYESFANEVKRFASNENIAKTVVPHWTVISKDGARALFDCGVKLLSLTSGGEKKEYSGNSSDLPYGHAGRLLQNKKPETMVYIRPTKDTAISSAICGYNYVSQNMAESMSGTFKTISDAETGITFKQLCNTSALNLNTLDEVESLFKPVLGKEYIGTMIHEQYFYNDYFAYQPDFDKKIYTMAKILHDNGYEFFFAEELVKN